MKNSIYYFNVLSPSFIKYINIHLSLQGKCCKRNGVKLIKHNGNGKGKIKVSRLSIFTINILRKITFFAKKISLRQYGLKILSEKIRTSSFDFQKLILLMDNLE